MPFINGSPNDADALAQLPQFERRRRVITWGYVAELALHFRGGWVEAEALREAKTQSSEEVFLGRLGLNDASQAELAWGLIG